jgi:diguanylate cyclase (GGDEF)-like protein
MLCRRIWHFYIKRGAQARRVGGSGEVGNRPPPMTSFGHPATSLDARDAPVGGKNVDGLLLAISVATIAALVMMRIHDLSAERDRYARALRHEATHDPLTGLPNRREFLARLKAELSLAPGCAILFCDLDRFKTINDHLGHDAGDALLVETARRMRACVRARDVVSRFGGDKFLILLRHTTLTEIETIYERIAEALSRPVLLQGEYMMIGVSIGMAVAQEEIDPEDFIKRADIAMYTAKRDHPSTPGVRRRVLT